MKIDKSKLFVRRLKVDELDVYMDFVEFAKSKMEHPEWLGEFSKKDYMKMFGCNAEIFVWTFFDNMNKEFTDINQFIACGMLIPAKKTDLEKFKLKELKYSEVIDFGPEIVHPDYIGNGLQMDVIDYLERIAISENYKYGVGTVAPDNIYSVRNLLKKDFEIANRVTLKRGERLVVKKDFK